MSLDAKKGARVAENLGFIDGVVNVHRKKVNTRVELTVHTNHISTSQFKKLNELIASDDDATEDIDISLKRSGTGITIRIF